MPRIAKDKNSKDSSKAKTVKKVSDSKDDKIVTAVKTKKTSSSKTTKSSDSVKAKKVSSTKTTKSSSTTKTKKSSTTRTTKSANTKNTTTKATKSSNTTITKKTSLIKENYLVEYYDLPINYNKTTVKLLAQTPKTLFVYWEISDDDRKIFIEKYGENFFENTMPILKIYNLTKNYNFEIEINDYANCWYINVNDSKCDYKIELERKFKDNFINPNYVYISSSNSIESPNNHILFEQNLSTAKFKNIKTNSIKYINLNNNIEKFYNIKHLYELFYSEEDLKNVSNTSSTFK